MVSYELLGTTVLLEGDRVTVTGPCKDLIEVVLKNSYKADGHIWGGSISHADLEGVMKGALAAYGPVSSDLVSLRPITPNGVID